jgi:hypothetical protein
MVRWVNFKPHLTLKQLDLLIELMCIPCPCCRGTGVHPAMFALSDAEEGEQVAVIMGLRECNLCADGMIYAQNLN